MNEPRIYLIFLKPNHGQDTKVARCPALGISASTTGNTEWAIQRVAMKAKYFPRKINADRMTFEKEGITLKQLTPACYQATINS